MEALLPEGSCYDPNDELRELAAACQNALDRASDYFGKIVVEGIVAGDQNNLHVIEGQSAYAVTHVLDRADYGIDRCTSPTSTLPAALQVEYSGIYRIEDSITYVPPVSSIGVQRIAVPQKCADDTELVAVTTVALASKVSAVSIPESSEALFARIWLKNDRVEHATILGTMPENEAWEKFCFVILGANSLVSAVLDGRFADDTELDQMLSQIRDNIVSANTSYDPERLHKVLSAARHLGRLRYIEQRSNHGVTAGRIGRLLGFAQALGG